MNVKTEMVEVNDVRFLREMFDFKPFGEISQYENVDDSSFFDVIGVITGPGRVISQSKYRLIEIEISDENHNKLFCTIWESNVDLYLDQLKKSEGTIPIVIIQFCKRNLFRGEIRISTHFQASKVVINADVKEVKDFRMRIRDDSRFLQQGSVIEGGQRLGGEYDDLQVKSLEDLSCLEFISFCGSQEGSCWVYGKIESVECHYGEWYFLACKTCVKKVREVDNKFNCSGCTKTHSYAVKRFKFVVNVVDHTSNASLLLWDREGSQLLGRSVTDFLGNGGQVAPKNSIPALIEEILVGQNVLFKLQLKNHIEYYRSYPFTVNKVCNLPEVVDKYTPKDLGEQIFKFDTKLSDLLFGADLAEVSQKPYATTDLSSLGNENISDLFVEGSELNVGVVVAEGSQKVFDTPNLSTVSNDKNHGWGAEGSVKRCLDLEFDRCADVGEVQMKKKEKIAGSN
ncbi:replication protein A 70 kDa DNA-binding subunit A-like isoform X2 [Salvia splendens]|uniref:replication protein A 70 kDa DNA-binding subunit A-like isoform X2 n=1 Tax=Salvia splendens TaxID=180675 RepID=UPI001C265BE4|nr:replication protein A 70 kDa DNA-binding subunit A-like isoform X2 [Salvia splendens]